MAMTTTSDLTNNVVTRYRDQYFMVGAENPGVWAQWVDWQDPIPEDGGTGGTQDWLVYGESDPVDSALAETTDPTPDTLDDFNVTVTPYEYGKTWGITKKLRYQARSKLPEVCAKIAAMNRMKSIDRIIRRGACGHGSSKPTLTVHIDDTTAMTSLTSTDTITYAFIQKLQAMAMDMEIEPFQGAGYICPAAPSLIYDIMQLTEWKTVGYYQDKLNIYGALGRPITLAGITFVPTNMGRIYLGAGTALQAATSLSAAANRQATTISVADATGITAGTYITIGTLETESVSPGTNLEQVLVTAVSTNDLTIRGNGQGTDFGLRFDHAISESVIESYNVAAVPIIGKNSVIGVHGADSGRYGIPKTKTGLDRLDRFTYYGWYWYGGVGLVQKNIILGKVALSTWKLGYN